MRYKCGEQNEVQDIEPSKMSSILLMKIYY